MSTVIITKSSSLAVSNSFVAHNNASGISVLPSGSAAVTAVFNRVEVYNNGGSGILVDGDLSTGTIKATVTDSVAANNVDSGIFSNSIVGQAATNVMVVRSLSANNGAGLRAEGSPATLRVSQSTVTGNASGWLQGVTAVLRSYADNNIDGNDANETAPTAIAKK